MTTRNRLKLKRRIKKTNPKHRATCVGGCGTFVLKYQAECRDCRRSRLHKGLKRIKKAERSNG